MRRAMTAVGMLLAVVLSPGCLDASGPADPGADATAASGTYAWGISDCAFVIAAAPVPAERLAPFLPEGFEPATTSPLPLPMRSGQAALEFDAYACAGGVGLDGSTLADVQYGSYYTAVRPPDQLRVDGHDAYFVKWDFLVPDEARRQVLTVGGLPARAGSAAVQLVPTPAGGASVHAELSLDGAGGFVLDGVVRPAEPLDALPFVEHTPLAAGGLAEWHARLHDAEIAFGVAMLAPTPGSWAHEVVGSDRVAVTFIAGRWNLDEAQVTFPIPWPPA